MVCWMHGSDRKSIDRGRDPSGEYSLDIHSDGYVDQSIGCANGYHARRSSDWFRI
jgi:hypothetical protein